MIALTKIKRNGERVSVDSTYRMNAVEGEVRISFSDYDARRTQYLATIEPCSLRKLRDECNRALSQITGHEYKTTVTIK